MTEEWKSKETPDIMLEWFFETLNKRLGPPYHIPLKDLFCIIPFPHESDFEFEIPRQKFWKGNDLENSYPYVYRLTGASRKESSIKVFFLKPDRWLNQGRIPKAAILNHKKYQYPKVSASSPAKSLSQIKIYSPGDLFTSS
jgi:hypothetical protein